MDTSSLVALAFGERGAASVRRTLEQYERLFSANLLEAELRSALAREQVGWHAKLVATINWVMPDRPLGDEMARVLVGGYLRGADLWHAACALYLHDAIGSLEFVTLDATQRNVIRAIGLQAASIT